MVCHSSNTPPPPMPYLYSIPVQLTISHTYLTSDKPTLNLPVENLRISCGKAVDILWKTYTYTRCKGPVSPIGRGGVYINTLLKFDQFFLTFLDCPNLLTIVHNMCYFRTVHTSYLYVRRSRTVVIVCLIKGDILRGIHV